MTVQELQIALLESLKADPRISQNSGAEQTLSTMISARAVTSNDGPLSGDLSFAQVKEAVDVLRWSYLSGYMGLLILNDLTKAEAARLLMNVILEHLSAIVRSNYQREYNLPPIEHLSSLNDLLFQWETN